MRLVAASALASFVLLVPIKLHAFETKPSFDRHARDALREIAEPPMPWPFLPSTIAAVFGKALAELRSEGDDVPEKRTISTTEICNALTAAAHANDLPVLFFLRLIWHESRFDPSAISRAGAQGIAQFMPRVATAMGLADPFDPAQALPTSARFLRALHQQFGNLGLAAAAYNAGARRIQDWLAKRGKLPQETRDYVHKITGLAPERWAKSAPDELELKRPPAPCDMPDTAVVRGSLIPLPPARPGEIRAASAEVKNSELSAASRPRRSAGAARHLIAKSIEAPARAWGVQVAAQWSEADARRALQRLRRQFPALLSGSDAVLVRGKPQHGPGAKTSVRLATQTRATANDLCARFKRAGGSCVVLRND
jgi:hypothetical protein